MEIQSLDECSYHLDMEGDGWCTRLFCFLVVETLTLSKPLAKLPLTSQGLSYLCFQRSLSNTALTSKGCVSGRRVFVGFRHPCCCEN